MPHDVTAASNTRSFASKSTLSSISSKARPISDTISVTPISMVQRLKS